MTLAARGQNNPLGVLRLETSAGTFAIKQMEREPAPGALQIEWAAYESGFPMPQPIRTRRGHLFQTWHAGQRRIHVRAYAWVDGRPYDWGVVNPRVSVEVGKLLAMLHALPLPEAALAEAPWMPLGRSRWEHFAERGDALRLPWARLLRDKVPALVAWEEHIQQHTPKDAPKVPSQRDLHPPNVMRQCTGRHVLVDWEGAGPVQASADVATFALVWATPEGGTQPRADAVRAFIKGYRSAGGRFTSRGIADLMNRWLGLLAWLRLNVERDIHQQPDATPDLTYALLSGLRSPDADALARMAALFRD
jgi:Ser/Thr protein kinase RdoA (MazF antagonist)